MTSAVPFKWLIAIGAILSISACDKVVPQKRTVCVTGYNEFERRIHEFWLDNENKSGCFGNPEGLRPGGVYGQSGFSCGCNVTPGKRVKLYWSFEQTRAEYDAREAPEEHAVQVIIPKPESADSRYLRVYFKKDGTNPIQWVDDMGAPELPLTPGNKTDE